MATDEQTHVHWYDRATLLVTVSGTQTHLSATGGRSYPEGTKANERKSDKHTHAHSDADPRISWRSRVSSSSLVSQ